MNTNKSLATIISDHPELKETPLKPVYAAAQVITHFNENKATQNNTVCLANAVVESTAAVTGTSSAYNAAATYNKCVTSGEGKFTCALSTTAKVAAETGTYVAGAIMIHAGSKTPQTLPFVPIGIIACNKSKSAGNIAELGTKKLMHALYDAFDFVSSYMQEKKISINPNTVCSITSPNNEIITLTQRETYLLAGIANLKSLSHMTSSIMNQTNNIDLNETQKNTDGLIFNMNKNNKIIDVIINDKSKIYEQLTQSFNEIKSFEYKTRIQLVSEENKRIQAQQIIRIKQEQQEQQRIQEQHNFNLNRNYVSPSFMRSHTDGNYSVSEACHWSDNHHWAAVSNNNAFNYRSNSSCSGYGGGFSFSFGF